MKTCLLLLTTLCLVASAAEAEPPALTLPASVKGTTGEFVTVAAYTPGKNVAWCALDPGLNLFPPALLKDTHTAVVTSAKPGVYRILAITASGDEMSAPVICKVEITAPQNESTPTAPEPAPAPPVFFQWQTTCGPNGCSFGATSPFIFREKRR